MSLSTKVSLRFGELDALRGVAALSVALFHFLFAYDALYQHTTALWWRPSADILREMALLPVTLFFMISGFVILMTIEKTEKVADFAISRFSRLYPAYWACMLMTLTFTAFLAPWRFPEPNVIAANVTMFQFYFLTKDIDPVYWSLIVEMNFYIAMAIIFRFGLIKAVTQLSAGWLFLAAVCSIFNLDATPLGEAIAWMLNLRWAPFFVAGIAFYLIWSGRRTMFTTTLLIASLLVNFAYAPLWAAATGSIFWGVFYLAVNGRLAFLSNRLFAFLGGISYCLYLLHQNIGFMMIERLEAAGVSVTLAVAASVLIALVLSTCVSLAVERPAQRYLRAKYAAWRESGKLHPLQRGA